MCGGGEGGQHGGVGALTAAVTATARRRQVVVRQQQADGHARLLIHLEQLVGLQHKDGDGQRHEEHGHDCVYLKGKQGIGLLLHGQDHKHLKDELCKPLLIG